MITNGWLLDCYPSLDGEGLTFWIKTKEGSSVKLKDSSWRAKIYAGGTACDNPDFIFSKLKDSAFVSSVRTVRKRTSVFESKRSRVLEIELKRPDRGKSVADLLESTFKNPSTFRLYNVDLTCEQQYFLEKGLFPLGRVNVYSNGEQITRWTLHDDAWATDYEIPPLKVMGLGLGLKDKVPRLDSRLAQITLTPSYYHGEQEETTIEPVVIYENDEAEMLHQLESEIQNFDPDFVITSNGDSFLFPYLYSKAEVNATHLNMSRDQEPAARSTYPGNINKQLGGRTYFSYGRIMFRPTTQRLYGRIHVDGQNTFVYDQCRFEGLFEIARISRMPFHTSSRASIGKSLSGLQFYHAYKRDMLIPYKPVVSEEIKSMENLLVADRGGLVFVPLPGIHERVCELDFASLYPSIIRQRNISAETVNCPCCPDSDNVIEELGMHICKKRQGIVPESLELPLSKRFEYKKLKAESEHDPMLKQVYNERAGALKWVLVTCIARESGVLIKHNGKIQYVKIGDFIDKLVGQKEGIIDCPKDTCVAGVGYDLKSKFCKVKKLLRISNKQRLLKITMNDGRTIIATPEHPFYLLKNGDFEIRLASELKEGNFIPVATKLPLQMCDEQSIDVIAELTRKLGGYELARWRVSGPALQNLILPKKRAVLDAATREGYSEVAVRQWLKTGRMPLHFFGLQSIERISISKRLHEEKKSDALFQNMNRMFRGDLGFVRVRKIETLDRIDEHVYCFQLADDELPGFFTGEGAVFTHNCFGYLSFRHAKFMKIDAHIAVCAIARETLLAAMHTAESRGFRVIHGIIDSLWLSKDRAKLENYREICEEIERTTKFKLAIEGIYKWIVFLPSKVDPQNQVANRYFGCFEKNNEIKVRGIEYRRHDAPVYFKKCQEEILKELSKCDNAGELLKAARDEGVHIFNEYAKRIERHEVPPLELLITRRLSKNLQDYFSQRQLSVNAAQKLKEGGMELKAGQSVSYLITRYKTTGKERAVPEHLAEDAEYDSLRYVELLADCCATILSPFGVGKKQLLSRAIPLQSWM